MWKSRSIREKRAIVDKINKNRYHKPLVCCPVCNKLTKQKFCSKKCCNKYFKGRSYEDIFGKNLALEIRKKHSQSMIKKESRVELVCPICKEKYTTYKKNKAKTCEKKSCRYSHVSDMLIGRNYIELYGKEDAEKIKQQRKRWCIGKTYYEIHGECDAEIRKENFVKSRFGKDCVSSQYKNFTLLVRKRIQERDNYTCQNCGYNLVGSRMVVHHVDYNPQNYKSKNLITVCTHCHTYIHLKSGVKSYFKKKFIFIQNERGIL